MEKKDVLNTAKSGKNHSQYKCVCCHSKNSSPATSSSSSSWNLFLSVIVIILLIDFIYRMLLRCRKSKMKKKKDENSPNNNLSKETFYSKKKREMEQNKKNSTLQKNKMPKEVNSVKIKSMKPDIEKSNSIKPEITAEVKKKELVICYFESPSDSFFVKREAMKTNKSRFQVVFTDKTYTEGVFEPISLEDLRNFDGSSACVTSGVSIKIAKNMKVKKRGKVQKVKGQSIDMWKITQQAEVELF